MVNKNKGKGKPSKSAQPKPKGTQKTVKAVNATPSRVPHVPQFKGAHGTGLSNCAQLYAKAFGNPFGDFEELPCTPCAPGLPTQRTKVVHRGTFDSQTNNGLAFICWAPMVPANDVNAIYSSTAASTGTSYQSGGAGVSVRTKSAQPYPKTAFDASASAAFMSARLVASAIRIRSVATPLKKNGVVHAHRASTGIALSALALAQLDVAQKDCVFDDVDGEWKMWAWIPQDEEDWDFPDGAVSYQALAGQGQPNYGIAITGSTSDLGTFMYEIVEFWEYIGKSSLFTATNLVMSHADPVGHARILGSIGSPPPSLSQKEYIRHMSEKIVEAMAHSDSVAKTVEDLLGMAGLSLPAVGTLVNSLVRMISL